MNTQAKRDAPAELIERCLNAFIDAGTLDLSLDTLAEKIGISKRMMVHYFGGREGVELQAMRRLEEVLRARFSPDSFQGSASLRTVILRIWQRSTRPPAKGIL